MAVYPFRGTTPWDLLLRAYLDEVGAEQAAAFPAEVAAALDEPEVEAVLSAAYAPINDPRFGDTVATENLFSNPSFVVPAVGGFPVASNNVISGVNSTSATSTTRARSGPGSLAVTAVAAPTGVGPAPRWDWTGLDPNTEYTFSLWAYNPSGNTTGVKLLVDSSGAGVVGGPVTGVVENTRDEWVQLAVTFTTGAVVDTANRVRLWYYSSFGGSQTTWVDDIGLTLGDAPITGDGDKPGWSWSGTPYNSPSTRDGVTYLVAQEASGVGGTIDLIVADVVNAGDSALSAAVAERVSTVVDVEVRRNPTPVNESHPKSTPGALQVVADSEDQDVDVAELPFPIGTIDGNLILTRGQALYGTTDNGRTTTLLSTLPNPGAGASGPQSVKEAGDGEVLVVRGIWGLWKSTGWVTNPTTATWAQVVDTSNVGFDAGEMVPWGLDSWENYVLASEYDGDTFTRESSNRLWLSTDNGATFTVIHDLRDRVDLTDVNQTHCHAACIDPYNGGANPRLWHSFHGQGVDQKIIYSDDLGATWTTFLDGNLIDNPGDAQPTVIVATEQSILFGSDGKPDGVLRALRTSDGLGPLERVWTYRSERGALTFICRRADVSSDGTVFFSFRARTDGAPGLVVMSDGVQAAEVYRWQGTAIQQPFVTYANVVDGEFVARQTIPADNIDSIIHGTEPFWGPALGAASAPAPAPGPDVSGIAALPVAAGYIATPRTTMTTGTMTLGRLLSTPLWITRPVTIEALAVDVTVAGTAGAVMRLGIYSTHATEGRPGALLVDAGTVATDAVGTPSVAVSLTLQPGLYWLAGVQQTAQATVRLLSGAPYTLDPQTLPGATMNVARREDSVTGALPVAAATGSAATRYNANGPVIWAKVTSVA